MKMRMLFEDEFILSEPHIISSWKISTEKGALATMMHRVYVGKLNPTKYNDIGNGDIYTLVAVSVFKTENGFRYKFTDYDDRHGKCEFFGFYYCVSISKECLQKINELVVEKTSQMFIQSA